MKEKQISHNKKKVRQPRRLPLFGIITCPKCGFDMELWTEEYETRCLNCGYRFFRRESTIH